LLVDLRLDFLKQKENEAEQAASADG